ncbi:DUF3570 domain-containing protein [Pendulispora albinea]|uniref:DUF3570 domain-containing protein n=1 Tax=Pendulispora albinea TaxID=2741071 RepID=A0ABZ2MB03_9BACT
MQLRTTLSASCMAAGLVLGAGSARAQGIVQFDTTHTIYHEAPTRSNMTVYSPSADLRASPAQFLDVRAGWEADIVSGASVAVKAGPTYKANHAGADVITTASVKDVRNVARGGFTLKNDAVSLTPGYTYSTEKDYKSHAIDIAARTELFEHNTQLEFSYAHDFDRVCDRVQSANAVPSGYRALENSVGCFTSDEGRRTRDIDRDGFQASWSQAWTRIFATQLVYSAEVLHGFLSNPYRSVIVGEGLKAQEHHPENRGRESLTLRANVFLQPLKSALRLKTRGYWDTWDVKSLTVEAEFERYFGEALRLTLRGRYYRQSGALFYSDDYTGGDAPLGPKGQYFTGDRELSPFSSVLLGLRVTYTLLPARGRLFGLMQSLKLAATGNVLQFDYSDYTLGGAAIGNARAYIGGLAVSAVF